MGLDILFLIYLVVIAVGGVILTEIDSIFDRLHCRALLCTVPRWDSRA